MWNVNYFCSGERGVELFWGSEVVEAWKLDVKDQEKPDLGANQEGV